MRRIFIGWFAILMLFFVAANLAGLVRPRGLKPFRYTGFPFTVSAWGFGIEEFFDWSALALNVLVAVVSSGLVALLCAWRRTASSKRVFRNSPPPVTPIP